MSLVMISLFSHESGFLDLCVLGICYLVSFIVMSFFLRELGFFLAYASWAFFFNASSCNGFLLMGVEFS